MFQGGAPLDLENLQALCGGPRGCHAAKSRGERGGSLVPGAEEWNAMVRSLALAPVPPPGAHGPVEVLLGQPTGDDHGAQEVNPAP